MRVCLSVCLSECVSVCVSKNVYIYTLTQIYIDPFQSCGGTLEVLYEDPKEDVASILSGGLDDDDRRKLLNPDDVTSSLFHRLLLSKFARALGRGSTQDILVTLIGATTLSITALSITTLSMTALSITAHSITTFSIMRLSKMTFSIMVNKIRHSA
jgi:hypothetical protein